MALLVLGNAGGDDVAAVAVEGLESADPDVRAAAAGALRFVLTAAAEARLLRAALEDVAPRVRAEALRSLAFRIVGAETLDAVARVARADSDEGVRMAAVQCLGGELEREPRLQAVLEEIARTESVTGVRNAARFALERQASGG